ncbi:nitric oxide reductase NorE protein [Roseovarius sp. MBR-79]|jgi:nitric oxide reductase NorE protein
MTDLLDELPGEPMMWVLIVSELLVFGAGLAALSSMRLTDPAGFAEAQAHLNRAGAALNTVVLVTSGCLAALAVRAAQSGREGRKRALLAGAMVLGVVFLVIKGQEYAAKSAQGIDWETHPFFTFYYLLTGFHAAHVVAGIVLLGLVAVLRDPRATETGAAFWHMVDLVWVLLFPVVYLIR